MLYQIIHTFEGFLNEPQLDGMTILLGRNEEAYHGENVDSLLKQRLEDLQKGGISGLVINVGGIGYLDSKEGWELFIKGLEAAVALGFKIWIYDEKGYPSGSAGGLTLRDNPEYEARGIKHAVIEAKAGMAEYCFKEKGDIGIIRCDLVYASGAHSNSCILRRTHEELIEQWEVGRCIKVTEADLVEIHIYYTAALYEGTHASRSYAEKRRYINLLDSKAVKKFIEVTYELYASKIPEPLFKQVEAFFTDEPSFMSVILPELDGKLVKKIPVLDEPDPQVPLLPTVPYSQELECELEKRYGLYLEDIVHELFAENKVPSAYKCAFWDAVARVYERTFALQMEEICNVIGKDLTGHIIFEDSPLGNMIFHSNPFRVLKHFHLPGVDLLSNKVEHIKVFAHKLPFSCAFFNGKTGIMAETSDFFEHRFNEKKPATPLIMASALSRQYLLGVREFSYYYDFTARSSENYAVANSIIKRTCEFGQSFEFNPEIAIYCPYETIWSGYIPRSSELKYVLEDQLSYVKDTDTSTIDLCDELFRQNIQFILVDESSIQDMIGKGIRKVVIPECKVIAKAVEEAALNGKLDLYGFRPEYVYEKGNLRPVQNELVIEDLKLIEKKSAPFKTSDGILFSAFKANKYYVFNSNESEAFIEAGAKLDIYDPYTDRREVKDKDEKISILQGQGIFVQKN